MLHKVEFKINFFELTFKNIVIETVGEDGTKVNTEAVAVIGNMLHSDDVFEMVISKRQFDAFNIGSSVIVDANVVKLYRVKFALIDEGSAYRDSSNTLVPYRTCNKFHFEQVLPINNDNSTLDSLSKINSSKLEVLSMFELMSGHSYNSATASEEDKSLMLSLYKR
jgi:hypothetical protein